jgi:hypothetical protein
MAQQNTTERSCRNIGPVLHMIYWFAQQIVIAFEMQCGLFCE